MVLFSYNKLVIEQRKRQVFLNYEIFFDTGSLFRQLKYSQQITYFFFKRRLLSGYFFATFKNYCFITNSSKVIDKRLALSRIKLSQKISAGRLPGFFHSI